MLLPVEQADAIAAMVQEGKMPTLHRSLVWMWSQDASLGGILALLIAFTYFLLPLTDYQGGIDLAAGLIASVLLVSASFAVLHRTWTRGLVVLVALGAVAVRCIAAVAGGDFPVAVGATLTGLVFALLVAMFLLEVYRPGPITRYRVGGAVAAYILLGLTWAYVYALVEFAVPGSLRLSAPQQVQRLAPGFRAEVVYFSFATMTTLGYGDVVPLGAFARSMAVLEALIGQLFVATLIARLVSLRPPSPSRLEEAPSSGE